jgi:hypothetical protein
MLGFQWTLDLDGMTYVGIESAQLGTENIGIHRGQLTMSYARATAAEPVTFTLIFESTKEGKPSEMIEIVSDITEAEGYVTASNGIDSNIEIIDLALDFDAGSETEEYALYQNEPNPFIDQTMIGFDLPRAMNAALTIYDATGKVIKEIKGDYAAGYNTVRLSRKDLLAGGVYYYHITAGDFTASKKLVLTN